MRRPTRRAGPKRRQRLNARLSVEVAGPRRRLNSSGSCVSSDRSAAKQNAFGARPAAREAGFLAEGDMDYAASPRALARSFST